jgi:hypothetical protein
MTVLSLQVEADRDRERPIFSIGSSGTLAVET